MSIPLKKKIHQPFRDIFSINSQERNVVGIEHHWCYGYLLAV